MNSLLNSYFGPLPKQWCLYFYFLSIIFGISFALSLISILGFMIFNFKKVNGLFIANSVMILINLLLAYFVNRLLNTMCVKSI